MDSAVFDSFPSPRDPNEEERFAVVESLTEIITSLKSFPPGIAEENIKSFLMSRHDNWADVYEELIESPNISVFEGKLRFEENPFYSGELSS